jgi:hypothetical protein
MRAPAPILLSLWFQTSQALTPVQLVPTGHPIRAIKPIAECALQAISPTLAKMYSRIGRPSIPPEHLLKASLLIALYSVRSERQFCERLQYDLLFKWFLDLNIADPAFHPTIFTKNRRTLLEHDVARSSSPLCWRRCGEAIAKQSYTFARANAPSSYSRLAMWKQKSCILP